MKFIFIFLFVSVCCLSINAIYLENVPYSVKDSSGNQIQLFYSGDESLAVMHDGDLN